MYTKFQWFEWLGALLCAIGLFFSTVTANTAEVHAFERAKNKAGKPLYWPRASSVAIVKYHIHQDGLDDYFKQNPALGQPGSEFAAIQTAFLTWSSLTCPDGRPVGLNVQFLGRLKPEQVKVGYDGNCASCNTNVVVFIRDRNLWRHNELVLAQTTVTPNETTGEILDADIEINATGKFIFSTQIENPENIKWDIQSVMAHEVGRLLGLDTSTEPKATMAAKADQGSLELRSLEKDDVAGICTIYPPSENATKIPIYQEVQAGRDLGCSIHSTQPSTHTFFLGVLFLLGWIVVAVRTKSQNPLTP